MNCLCIWTYERGRCLGFLFHSSFLWDSTNMSLPNRQLPASTQTCLHKLPADTRAISAPHSKFVPAEALFWKGKRGCSCLFQIIKSCNNFWLTKYHIQAPNPRETQQEKREKEKARKEDKPFHRRQCPGGSAYWLSMRPTLQGAQKRNFQPPWKVVMNHLLENLAINPWSLWRISKHILDGWSAFCHKSRVPRV